MSSNSINYAALSGIDSVSAAVIFAILFLIAGAWFVRQTIKNTTQVHIVLILFCAIRVTAFILRAIMAHSTSQGSNLNLFITDQVLLAVGFFALVYSAYTLVLDRDVLAGGERQGIFSPNLLRNARGFRLILSVGVALGITAVTSSTSSDPGDAATGKTLRKAGTAIFLALTVIQLAQSVLFFSNQGYSKSSVRSWGDRNGRYLLCVVSLLMLVREVFVTATINDASKQNDERLWYPLVVLPEFLAVLCYSVTGLVPTRAALKKAENK
ncbi:hypothetical protein B0H15DRAFT_947676 [Mycena belliarum]|uniref:DUF7702 domain-containing protein n=1 Tax=Mycena belliarum TaxID=1033014 RepID=A0AAD6U7E6_9AGAR|nr:hypothetical protein B0H15DRAFT_947676 [Mycena belliae]